MAAVLPLYHINAFAVTMLAPLAHGGSLVMPPKFSAAGFWEMATRHRLHVAQRRADDHFVSARRRGARDASCLPRIRFCRSASAALPPEHHRAFEAKFGIGIIETMGLTETVAPAFSNPIEPGAAQDRLASGEPSGCEARVVDAERRAARRRNVGEIVIRGPQVMPGYYKNRGSHAGASSRRWLRTGDLAIATPMVSISSPAASRS